MNFSTMLCILFSQLNGEKTASAAFYLLRGKRSGQSIQDVHYYNVKMFFGLLPKLSKEVFDEAVDDLKKSKYIYIDHAFIVRLTEKGKEHVQEARKYHFNGWDYRGREEIFFSRLSLIVQTVSNFRVGEKSFMPTQRDTEVQQFVKGFLYGKPITDPSFARKIKNELQFLLEESGMDENQKIILTHRLVGYRYTGWTWDQLASQLNIHPISIKLYFIESLHMLLQTIERTDKTPLINMVANKIKISSHLTASTQVTKSLFDKGLMLEEIAAHRQLKLSTIEDHFVEIAMSDDDFPLHKFVSFEESKDVWEKSFALKTKRLRVLKEIFPELTYFQLRLILGAHTKGTEKKWI